MVHSHSSSNPGDSHPARLGVWHPARDHSRSLSRAEILNLVLLQLHRASEIFILVGETLDLAAKTLEAAACESAVHRATEQCARAAACESLGAQMHPTIAAALVGAAAATLVAVAAALLAGRELLLLLLLLHRHRCNRRTVNRAHAAAAATGVRRLPLLLLTWLAGLKLLVPLLLLLTLLSLLLSKLLLFEPCLCTFACFLLLCVRADCRSCC